jgi:hypothetical protein
MLLKSYRNQNSCFEMIVNIRERVHLKETQTKLVKLQKMNL